METLHNNRWKFVGPVSGFDPDNPLKKGWLFSTFKVEGGTDSYTISYHISEEVRYVDQRNRLIKYYENLNLGESDNTCLCVKSESLIIV